MTTTDRTLRTAPAPDSTGMHANGTTPASTKPAATPEERPAELTDSRRRRGYLSEGATKRAATTQARSRGGRRRRHLVRFVEAVIVGGLVAASSYAVSGSGHEPVLLGPGVVTVQVAIDQSQFDLGELRVQEGTLVQFVVRNDDPIDHELVVGDAAVHRRHAEGSEGRHPPIPGEVSIAPGDTAMTFYEFNEPGIVVFACHLPGHAEYGMTGDIEVVAAS